MSANIEKVKGRITIYASGGAGTNIASRLEKHRGKTNPGFAIVDPVYIDTSKSNLINKEIPGDAIYHFSGLDGAGQVRREHAATVKERVKEILLKHVPGDLAIVLHSGSGGSGSVIGPLVAAETLAREIPTLVIMVGDASTRLYAENTLNTIKSYEAISKSTGAPVVMALQMNTSESPRAAVDTEVEYLVEALAALFSRENSELDSQDLFNFLRFDSVTSFKDPMVAAFSVIKAGEPLNHLGNVISVASLAKPGTEADFPVMPEVRFLGVLPEDMIEEVAKHSPVHYITSDGIIHDTVANINAVLKQLTDAQGARTARKSLLGAGERADEDSGLIL